MVTIYYDGICKLCSKEIDYYKLSNIKTQNIQSLIDESEILLKELSWDHIRGREYLQNEFNVSTRKELNEEQLMSFLVKLKSIQSK